MNDMHKQNRGCHDDQAEEYDDQVRSGLGDYIRENYFMILDRVVELSELAAGMSVLDIGIGTGLLTERMPQGPKLYGVDLSLRMMDKLREKGLDVELRQGDFLHLPFPDASFERIVSTFAFHHLTPEEKIRAFGEMDRVLKPGGKLVIGDFMVENQRQRQELADRFTGEGREDMLREMEEEDFLDIEAGAGALRGMGYEVAQERGSTLSWILKGTRAGKD